jgi:hypothetical protein
MIVSSGSGWRTEGIGAAYPYPSGYLVALVTGGAVLLLGSRIALWLFAFGIAAACAFGGATLSMRLGAPVWARFAAALFVVANPWVYTQTVAGHTYMILAYGGTLLLVAELLRREARTPVLLLCALATLPQLQYFLPVLVALVAHAVRSRNWRPALGAAAAFAPCAVGLLAEHRGLSSTLYALVWQNSQSIGLPALAILTGYFANYADPLPAATWWALWAVVALATVGFVFVRRNAVNAAAIAGLAALLLASGTKGPLSRVYASIVEHVPASGLYRELYDVIGFVAVAYVVLVAAAAARFPIVSALYVVAAACLVALWVVTPVWSFWIPAGEVPAIAVAVDKNVRFAATPGFGSLEFRGKGSGLDPEAFARPVNVTPLVEANRTYPADAALARYERSEDVDGLRRLSVAFVFSRPYLRTDAGSLFEQVGVRDRATALPGLPASRVLADPTPELSISDTLAVGSIADRTGDGNLWFADVTPEAQSLIGGALPGGTFVPVTASNAEIEIDRGWVDERLSMIVLPQFAHAVGGAITSSNAWLDVSPGLDALVDVQGTLRGDDGSLVSGNTGGPRWVRLDPRIHRVRCFGLCLVAGQGRVPAGVPTYPTPVAARAVAFDQVTPWLAVATLPNDGARVLRYNVAYDQNWLALTNSGSLSHLRLDATTNAWILPAHGGPRLVLVHIVAAIQAAIEFAVVVWLIAWLVRTALRTASLRRSQSRT